MEPVAFESKEIILDEGGPFAEYLRSTSQRIDNVRYENFDEALQELKDEEYIPEIQLQHEDDEQMLDEIDHIQRRITQEEHQRFLFLLYIVIPCLIQPIPRHQCKLNDVLSDRCYDVDSTAMQHIYSDLFSYFHGDPNEENIDTLKSSLFSTPLIIHHRSTFFFLLLVHLVVTLSLFYLIPTLPHSIRTFIFCVELLDIIFVAVDLLEFNQWICFLNGTYEMMRYLSSFQRLVDRTFRVLNNVTAATNGYGLHHQYVPSYKIELKLGSQYDATSMHLEYLRLQLHDSLVDINCTLFQMTSFIAEHRKSEEALCAMEKRLMLKDLLLLYRHFRIHQKVLFTQLYRISSPLLFTINLWKSIRAVWCRGCIWMYSLHSIARKRNYNEFNDNLHFIESPFTAHRLHIDLSVGNILKFLQCSIQWIFHRDTAALNASNPFNRFNALNHSLSDFTIKLRAANLCLFQGLKLSKTPKQFTRFSSTKISNVKKRNLSKIEEKLNENGLSPNGTNTANTANTESLKEIYQHLHRLQHRVDEITSSIYLLHEQCITNPDRVLVDGPIESKYSELDDNEEVDIGDEVEQYKSLEILRNVMIGINRSFNEWKYIVSVIHPDSKLLDKYKNIGFGPIPSLWAHHRRRYDPKMETVHQSEDDERRFEEQKKKVMTGLFAKLNKQRARMSVTNDGEELYEPNMEAIRQRISAEQKEKESQDGEDQRDLLSASMETPGSGISTMDKLNMVDELKNVLRNRKQAAIRRFQEKQRRERAESHNIEEHGDDGYNERKDEEEEDSEGDPVDGDNEFVGNELNEINKINGFNTFNPFAEPRNVRGGYHEELIENEYDVRSSDEEDLGPETTVTEEQERRFMMEMRRLGFHNGALMTTKTNTQIQSI